MDCFVHERTPAVGVCAACQKAVCRACIGGEQPRLVCRACVEQRRVLGFEYRSGLALGPWPLLHVCLGVDPVTMRPRVAKGVIAIGNIAVGGVAIAGLACGLVSLGGLSIGVLLAVGGAALGLGVSFGGLAVGSVAVGGMALGFVHAIGGAAFGPAVIDGRRCDPGTVAFVRQWLGEAVLPPQCR